VTAGDPPDDRSPGRSNGHDAARLAERRLRDEIARHRRTERRQLAAVKWGCISVLAAVVILLIVGVLVS
jgi:hypothetical protein